MSATQTGSHRNKHKGMQALLAKTTTWRKVWTSSLHENKEYSSRNSKKSVNTHLLVVNAFGLPSCVSRGADCDGKEWCGQANASKPQEQASGARWECSSQLLGRDSCRKTRWKCRHTLDSSLCSFAFRRIWDYNGHRKGTAKITMKHHTFSSHRIT